MTIFNTTNEPESFEPISHLNIWIDDKPNYYDVLYTRGCIFFDQDIYKHAVLQQLDYTQVNPETTYWLHFEFAAETHRHTLDRDEYVWGFVTEKMLTRIEDYRKITDDVDSFSSYGDLTQTICEIRDRQNDKCLELAYDYCFDHYDNRMKLHPFLRYKDDDKRYEFDTFNIATSSLLASPIIPAIYGITSIIWSGIIWVITSDAGEICYTDNGGSTWHVSTGHGFDDDPVNPKHIVGCIYYKGRYVAITKDGYCAISDDDCYTWDAAGPFSIAPNVTINCIVAEFDLFFAFGDDGFAAISSDGVHWRPLDIFFGFRNALVADANGDFVVVGGENSYISIIYKDSITKKLLVYTPDFSYERPFNGADFNITAVRYANWYWVVGNEYGQIAIHEDFYRHDGHWQQIGNTILDPGVPILGIESYEDMLLLLNQDGAMASTLSPRTGAWMVLRDLHTLGFIPWKTTLIGKELFLLGPWEPEIHSSFAKLTLVGTFRKFLIDLEVKYEFDLFVEKNTMDETGNIVNFGCYVDQRLKATHVIVDTNKRLPHNTIFYSAYREEFFISQIIMTDERSIGFKVLSLVPTMEAHYFNWTGEIDNVKICPAEVISMGNECGNMEISQTSEDIVTRTNEVTNIEYGIPKKEQETYTVANLNSGFEVPYGCQHEVQYNDTVRTDKDFRPWPVHGENTIDSPPLKSDLFINKDDNWQEVNQPGIGLDHTRIVPVATNSKTTTGIIKTLDIRTNRINVFRWSPKDDSVNIFVWENFVRGDPTSGFERYGVLHFSEDGNYWDDPTQTFRLGWFGGIVEPTQPPIYEIVSLVGGWMMYILCENGQIYEYFDNGVWIKMRQVRFITQFDTWPIHYTYGNSSVNYHDWRHRMFSEEDFIVHNMTNLDSFPNPRRIHVAYDYILFISDFSIWKCAYDPSIGKYDFDNIIEFQRCKQGPLLYCNQFDTDSFFYANGVYIVLPYPRTNVMYISLADSMLGEIWFGTTIGPHGAAIQQVVYTRQYWIVFLDNGDVRMSYDLVNWSDHYWISLYSHKEKRQVDIANFDQIIHLQAEKYAARSGRYVLVTDDIFNRNDDWGFAFELDDPIPDEVHYRFGYFWYHNTDEREFLFADDVSASESLDKFKHDLDINKSYSTNEKWLHIVQDDDAVIDTDVDLFFCQGFQCRCILSNRITYDFYWWDYLIQFPFYLARYNTADVFGVGPRGLIVNEGYRHNDVSRPATIGFYEHYASTSSLQIFDRNGKHIFGMPVGKKTTESFKSPWKDNNFYYRYYKEHPDIFSYPACVHTTTNITCSCVDSRTFEYVKRDDQVIITTFLLGDWCDSVSAPNGYIYRIPKTAGVVARVDPLFDTVAFLNYGLNLNKTKNVAKWSQGILAGNKIFCIPSMINDFLVIDWLSDYAYYLDMGIDFAQYPLDKKKVKFLGGVLHDDIIYCVSAHSAELLIINTVTEKAEIHELTYYDGDPGWGRGVVVGNEIWFPPHASKQRLVLEIGTLIHDYFDIMGNDDSSHTYFGCEVLGDYFVPIPYDKAAFPLNAASERQASYYNMVTMTWNVATYTESSPSSIMYQDYILLPDCIICIPDDDVWYLVIQLDPLTGLLNYVEYEFQLIADSGTHIFYDIFNELKIMRSEYPKTAMVRNMYVTIDEITKSSTGKHLYLDDGGKLLADDLAEAHAKSLIMCNWSRSQQVTNCIQDGVFFRCEDPWSDVGDEVVYGMKPADDQMFWGNAVRLFDDGTGDVRIMCFPTNSKIPVIFNITKNFCTPYNIIYTEDGIPPKDSWRSCVLTWNNDIVCLPYHNSEKTLIIDLDTNTARQDDFGMMIQPFESYCPGPILPNGNIFGIPTHGKLIMKWDTVGGYAFIYELEELLNEDDSYAMYTCYVHDETHERIYAIPSKGAHKKCFLVIDLKESTVSYEPFDFDFKNPDNFGEFGWSHAIMVNSDVWCLPIDSPYILVLDTTTNRISAKTFGLPDFHEQPWAWKKMILMGSKIYCLPENSLYFLIIDTVNFTATKTDFGFYNDFPKYFDFVPISDTEIYCIPNGHTKALIINTVSDTAVDKDITLMSSGGKAVVSLPDAYEQVYNEFGIWPHQQAFDPSLFVSKTHSSYIDPNPPFAEDVWLRTSLEADTLFILPQYGFWNNAKYDQSEIIDVRDLPEVDYEIEYPFTYGGVDFTYYRHHCDSLTNFETKVATGQRLWLPSQYPRCEYIQFNGPIPEDLLIFNVGQGNITPIWDNLYINPADLTPVTYPPKESMEDMCGDQYPFDTRDVWSIHSSLKGYDFKEIVAHQYRYKYKESYFFNPVSGEALRDKDITMRLFTSYRYRTKDEFFNIRGLLKTDQSQDYIDPRLMTNSDGEWHPHKWVYLINPESGDAWRLEEFLGKQLELGVQRDFLYYDDMVLSWIPGNKKYDPMYVAGRDGPKTEYEPDHSFVGMIKYGGSLWAIYFAPYQFRVSAQWKINIQPEDPELVDRPIDFFNGYENTYRNVMLMGGVHPAMNYCRDLYTLDKFDWYLPSPMELRLLSQFDGYDSLWGMKYWSSAECEHQPGKAFAQDFKTRSLVEEYKINTNLVWPVRRELVHHGV